MKKLLRNKKQNGFTLIELLVVIAIIGLLASVVLLALNSARAKSRDAKRVADVRQLSTALELYYNDHNAYPIQTTVGAIPAGSGATAFQPNYIGALPVPPTPADGSCTTTPTYSTVTTPPAAAGPNAYSYVTDTNGTTYTISFCVGAQTGGLAAGGHTASPTGIQ